MSRPAAGLRHRCLVGMEESGEGLLSLGEAAGSDKGRLGLLLQGLAVVAHCRETRRHLPGGWAAAGVDGDGVLRVGSAEPGRSPRLPQEEARELLQHLFTRGRRRRVAGRGEARRIARLLQRRWDDALLPLPPDLLLAHLLEEAPFVWEPPFAAARRTLAGEHRRGGEARLWVAGPGPMRWRLLGATNGDLEELEGLLADEGARGWWRGVPRKVEAYGDPAQGLLPLEVAEPSAAVADRAPSAKREKAPGKTAGAAGRGRTSSGSKPPRRTAPPAAPSPVAGQFGVRSPPDPQALSAAGRWRAAVAAWEERPPADAAERRELARAWLALGRARRALAVLAEGEPAAADLPLVAACQLHLGRLRAARRTVSRASEAKLSAAERLAVAEVEARARANAGDPAGGWECAMAAVAAVRRGPARLRARAHLLAAQAAWDGGEAEAMERHLAKAPELEGEPELEASLRQTRALAALAAGDAAAAAGELSAALARHRRRLPLYAAAGLWNDLGVARARSGDLAGAEKALARSLALYRGCEGSRRTTLGLANLAEVRLRRGRLDGVEEILERTSAANRAAGNRRGSLYDLLLWGRFELAHGRAAAALEVLRRCEVRCRSAGVPEVAEEARLLAARALGWLGRGDEAAAELDAVPGAALDHLEPEERPALLAHAGRRDEALAAAAGGALAALWQAALAGGEVPAGAWAALDDLGAFRAARAVFDLELTRPAAVPGPRRRRAAAMLRRRGAVRLAERLEARDEGPWRALANHLEGARGRAVAWPDLLADAGHPEARVWWESEDDARVLVPGPGGGDERTGECAGGRLVLRAPLLDAPAEALFELLRRETAARGLEDGGGRPPSPAADGEIVGEDPVLRRAVERAERLAPGEVPILVLGESGTGKELVARRIHRTSRRRDRPLVAVNCAALSETLVLSELFGHVRGAFTGADRDRAGVFETGDGGTVFLDEIGDLPPPAQGMLLRVLQEGEVRRVGESLPRRVDVRLVAATHRDLAAGVAAGGFRRDLYYRLKGAAVELPPLRRRGRDVLRLADHLLAAAHRRGGGEGEPPRLAEEARARLLAHAWPGNVRELENVLAVAAALAAADGGVIGPEHLDLPAAAAGAAGRPAGYHQQVEALRRRLVEEALAAAGGNQAAAARALGLSRQALSYLVRKLEVL
jgi:DNA-binding NtrC family response regulator